ncbi:hypothetical protein Q9L58_006517 [Maublancomyces gigas]|uniref:Uncharacterized protein n=1 Tax=Discina gigas TaxID=1032678 RepID=A0ABR3GF29_9PEZI
MLELARRDPESSDLGSFLDSLDNLLLNDLFDLRIRLPRRLTARDVMDSVLGSLLEFELGPGLKNLVEDGLGGVPSSV